MRSYKQWQTINETLGAFPIGVSSAGNKIGSIRGAFQFLDEKKLEPKEKEEKEEGEEEFEKCCGKYMKKYMKKYMDEEDEIENDEDDDEDEDEEEKIVSKKKKKKDIEGEEEEEIEKQEEEEERDLDNDEEEGEPEEHKKKVLGYMSKKDKKKTKKGVKKESTEEFLNSIFNSYSPSKEIEDNDDSFWDSLTSQYGNPKEKFGSGIQEDYLIPPTTSQEPAPGDVGFAPQQRIGNSWDRGDIDEALVTDPQAAIGALLRTLGKEGGLLQTLLNKYTPDELINTIGKVKIEMAKVPQATPSQFPAK